MVKLFNQDIRSSGERGGHIKNSPSTRELPHEPEPQSVTNDPAGGVFVQMWSDVPDHTHDVTAGGGADVL